MIKKGKWTVPGYRVRLVAVGSQGMVTDLCLGEVRRVLSHVVCNVTYALGIVVLLSCFFTFCSSFESVDST
jgi:hypothetical protein